MEEDREHQEHSPIDNAILSFDVPGRTILALYNAIEFTLSHRDEFAREIDDCRHCLDALKSLDSYFWNLMNYGKNKKNLKNRFN